MVIDVVCWRGVVDELVDMFRSSSIFFGCVSRDDVCPPSISVGCMGDEGCF